MFQWTISPTYFGEYDNPEKPCEGDAVYFPRGAVPDLVSAMLVNDIVCRYCEFSLQGISNPAVVNAMSEARCLAYRHAALFMTTVPKQIAGKLVCPGCNRHESRPGFKTVRVPCDHD